MRREIAIIVAAMLFIFVGYLAYSGRIIFLDYWTALAVTLTVSAFGILYWGFKPRIDRSFKDKKNIQESKTEITPSLELEKRKSELLPDSRHVTKLNIDDELLDRIYEQARQTAINLHDEAQLSGFTIQVYPYRSPPSVAIYLDFYSKWTDKICEFQYSDLDSELRHTPPDKSPRIDSDKNVFDALPWKTSPQWKQFLHRAYTKIRPLPPVKETCYHLSASPSWHWNLRFDDGLSGKEYSFEWKGKGLDENSIKQSR
jgi:hypothetical protein